MNVEARLLNRNIEEIRRETLSSGLMVGLLDQMVTLVAVFTRDRSLTSLPLITVVLRRLRQLAAKRLVEILLEMGNSTHGNLLQD